ncbi:MAG: lysylphosphatidylglycerol synthase transmembrane domain-containing protein [Chthoniobacteraceae bacterium]|jgi:uncharacterized membrane protein YbhN (UPF0104 family)
MKKKTILTIIQVFVTVGILFWVFHDPKTRAEMWDAMKRASHGWLLMGFLCYGVVEILAAFRWFVLLRVQEVRLPLWRVGALLMLGIFFNMFMPGGTGGDLVKIYFLLKEIPTKKAGGLLAVLMDRLIGLMALIMISSVIIWLQYDWLKTAPVARNLTWTLLAILASSFGAIVFSFVITGFGLVRKLPARLPMRDVLIDLSVAYNAYARAWPSSLLALLGSFGVHAASFTLYYCAARALSIHTSSGALIPYFQLMAVMPIILTICSLPISVGGTGVREALFVALLGPLLGVPKGDAVMLSFTGFLLSAAWGVIGGIIYLCYRPSEHAKLSEVERQVLELEHEVAEGEETVDGKETAEGEKEAEEEGEGGSEIGGC